MQLKKSKNTAEDELMRLINEGYKILRIIRDDEYKQNIGRPHLWGIGIRDWRMSVHKSLIAIFPDTLEADTFDNTPEPFSLELFRDENRDKAYSNAENMMNKSIQILSQFKDIRLMRYAEGAEQDNKREPLSGQLTYDEIPAAKTSPPTTKNALSHQNISNTVKMQSIAVLLVTVTEVETSAILSLFPNPRPFHKGDQTYHDLGSIEEARIFLVQSEMGSGGQSGSILTIQEAIDALHPAAIVMVGIAFGIDQSKYQIGDILVSKQIVGYELQRVSTGPQNERIIIPRGDRPSASHRMLSIFRAAAQYWQAPPKVEFGLLLSGDKLVDNQDFRNQLLSLEPEAIGGEMEGAGLYAVAQRRKVDWILVKAICDWADGNKRQDKRRHQQLAAENAARFIVYVLKQGGFERSEREITEMPLSDLINNDKSKSAEQHLADLKCRVELNQKRASEQGQQGNKDLTIQEISNYTINTIRKSLM